MNGMPFNRKALNEVGFQAESGRRMVGGGDTASWPSPSGGTIVDLTPETFVGRLTAERVGAAYGWERVFVQANDTGDISVEVAADGSANFGSPTNLPAIEPNGDESLTEGTIVFLWPCEPGGVWQYMIMGTGGAGDAAVCVDTVHVVGEADGLLTCRRVTLGDPGEWPPAETDPVVEYTGVFESENRKARIVDSPGTATHIIPLYIDSDGNYFVVFWKTCTFADISLLTNVAVTTVQNSDCTFTNTVTQTFTTERWFVDVNPPGNPASGLRLRIGTTGSLPDTCS